MCYIIIYLFCLQVESFVIDQAELDEEARLETSKFLLSPEDTDHSVDPETQARLEALLEAAGEGKHLLLSSALFSVGPLVIFFILFFLML